MIAISKENEVFFFSFCSIKMFGKFIFPAVRSVVACRVSVSCSISSCAINDGG